MAGDGACGAERTSWKGETVEEPAGCLAFRRRLGLPARDRRRPNGRRRKDEISDLARDNNSYREPIETGQTRPAAPVFRCKHL